MGRMRFAASLLVLFLTACTSPEDASLATPSASAVPARATSPPTPTTAPATPVAATPVPPAPPTAVATIAAPVSYANCAAVRAAGKSPLLRGQPGYNTSLDRDGDGVACE